MLLVSALSIMAVVVCRWSGCGVRPAAGARILAVETVPSRSHWNFMNAVLGALTDAGHTVTAFTPFPGVAGRRQNYTEIDTSDPRAPRGRMAMNVADVRSAFGGGPWGWLTYVSALSARFCDRLRDDRAMNALLARGLSAEFDAILIEPVVAVDCHSFMVSASGGLPLIFVMPTADVYFDERSFTGHASNPAAVSPVVADHAVPRTFARRLSNAVTRLGDEVAVACLKLRRRLTTAARPYDSRAPVPPSLVFVNGLPFGDAAAGPTPANCVRVGGVHLKPAGSVPEDVLKFIEESTHGVILFTFGSTLAMSSIEENIQNIFCKVLAKLPQRVLMKYEGEMKNTPKNVMTSKWIPQREVLMHPNVKLFISHGGISGVYEAVDAGVPILGFPIFFDQYRNIDSLVESGMAISMELFSVSEETLLKNIEELINNEKYMKNAKIASDVFNDRPMSPQKSVVYWTEYVIRHKGAPHLKSHGLNLMWYQYYLLDVLLVMLLLISAFLLISYKILKTSYNYLFSYFHAIKTKCD